MQINTFTKKLLALCLVLIVAIIALSVLLSSNGPRVRYIESIDDISKKSQSQNSSLRIVFDRPIEQADHTSSIQITPTVAFTTQTATQGVTITFEENLLNNTSYTIAVLPNIRDKTGQIMKNSYQESFTVAGASYAYIERNYAFSREAIKGDATEDDHIKIARLGEEPETIFSHPEIRTFVANSNYVAVVVKEDQEDQLFTINLATREIRKDDTPTNNRINNLSLGSRGNMAVFTTLPEIEAVSEEYYATYANRATSINLSSGETTTLTGQDDTFLTALEVFMDREGQVALLQDELGAYAAVSPFNDYAPVPIGTYDDAFGFIQNNSEILFRSRENFIRYSIREAVVNPVNFETLGFIRSVESPSDTLFYSLSSFTSGSLKSSINATADEQDGEVTVWRNSEDDSTILRTFKPSYDNTLLGIQLDTDDCQFDTIGVNSACTTAQQIIYDIEDKSVIASFPGINFMWLP